MFPVHFHFLLNPPSVVIIPLLIVTESVIIQENRVPVYTSLDLVIV